MRYLITGGAGFLGCHLARALVARGDSVDLADDLSRGAMDEDLERLLARPEVRLVRCDLTESGCWRAWGDDYDAVFHLAAIVGVRNVVAQPERVLAVNARALLNVVEWFAASGSRKLLFSSTSEVYAWTARFHPLPVPTPEDVPLAVDDLANGRAAYALSKMFGEMAVMHACARADKPYAIMRYHNVYGPRMGMDHAIPEIFARVHAGQRPLQVYSASERRAFCYVADAVDATLRLAGEAKSGVFNVGSDEEEVAIEDLARLICELAGAGETPIAALPREGPAIARRCPDLERLKRETGYRPRVPLREGLVLTLDWYRRRLSQASPRTEDANAQVR